jgi:hypothetical protein
MQIQKTLTAWLGLAAIFSSNSASVIGEEGVCTSSDRTSCQSTSMPTLDRPLRPSDLPQPIVFTSFGENTTVTLPNGITQTVAPGMVTQINNFDNHNDVFVDFAVLPQAVNRSDVANVLELLRAYDDWDDDPDSVDGMTSHEMFLWR